MSNGEENEDVPMILVKDVIVKVKNDLPADFMKGYTRDVHMTGKVLLALGRAMEVYPSLRVGQLLYNAIASYDETDGPTYLISFHSRLFNIYDERLIEALEKFTALKTESDK